MNIEELFQDIADIKARNARVELDKAWETSWTRRLFLAALTYIVAAIWLLMIHDPNSFLKALVPAAGYLLSTLSLPIVRRWWGRKK
ncbi:MAG: hypothetical protein HYV42_01135 [Candidatus Magasanikbacteria bacterium]|nr:hypothetical protein [Candidatus Magasanikbacteria bacterium]